ncbi:MAG: hypothetical protein AAB558_02585 [Patescibacteria group bacterium]
MYVPSGWLVCLALYLVTLGTVGISNLFGGLTALPSMVMVFSGLTGLVLLVTGPYYAWMRWETETDISATRDKMLSRSTAFISYFVPERNMDEWHTMVRNVTRLLTKVSAAIHPPVPARELYWVAHDRLIDQLQQTHACLRLIDQAEARLDEMQLTWVGELLEMYPSQIQRVMPDATDERAVARHFRKQLEQELQGLSVIRKIAGHLLANHRRTKDHWRSIIYWHDKIPPLIQAAQELRHLRPG